MPEPVIDNIKDKLSNICTFPEAMIKAPSMSLMGYVRCDHDGWQWWSTCFPVNRDLETPDRAAELDAITDALHEAFPTLAELKKYCTAKGEDQDTGYDYYLYLSDESLVNNYFIHACTRRNDYNLRIHAIVKEAVI